MQHVKYSPVKLIKKLTGNICTTGQKNYALALQRAAQFNSPVSEATLIKAECSAAAIDFSATTIIHYGVHHAKK